MISLSEVFHSIEGEGIRIGMPTLFVRVQGCPYQCPYCDTKYAQAITSKDWIASSDLVEIIRSYEGKEGRHCEFTGGDPSLYTADIIEVIKALPDWSFTIQAIGDKDLEDDFREVRDRVRFAYDMKDEDATGIHFKVNPANLTERDEVKIIVDDNNYATMRERIVQTLQNTPVPIIISSISNGRMQSLEEEVASWRWVTEKVLLDISIPFEIKDRIHILPRLQQLYWRYERGK